VPLVREDAVVGTLRLHRHVPEPFSARQIALAETFAHQALIAIENARLFDELQARNQELSEGLERERATGEVLAIISRALTDAQPVLDAILERALRLCDSRLGSIQLLRDGVLYVGQATTRGEPPTRIPFEDVGPEHPTGAAIVTRQSTHIWGSLDAIAARYPRFDVELHRGRGRSELAYFSVPLLRSE